MMFKKIEISIHKKNSIIYLIGFIFMFLSFDSFAQVLKPFQQRTSTQVEDKYKNKTIYNLRGDFKMIGNTNLSRNSTSNPTTMPSSNTQDNWSNSNEDMYFVDIDDDDTTTNSSRAELSLPANCTNIVYAGLYWSGRNNTSWTPSANNSYTTRHNQNINNNNEVSLKISTGSQPWSNAGFSGTFYYPIYTISNADNSVYLEIHYRARVNTIGQNANQSITYRTSQNGTFTNVDATFQSTNNNDSDSDNNNLLHTAILNNPIPITVGEETYYISKLQKRRRSNNSEDNFFQNSLNLIEYYSISQNTYDGNKTKIKFKKEGQPYQNYTADDFHIGTSDEADIFTAYKDVTAYVKQHGVGNYFGANIDLVEGDGGSAGYFGGWGLIVIYENPSMSWRDITIFDGYAHVAGNNGYQLPLSGFRAAQSGNINVTMGMMAGEGDRGISGDNFRIRNASNTDWVYLNHSNNQTSGTANSNNFFNSTILTDGARWPTYSNNTGLDIVKFNLTNTNNSLIGNNQTSTIFRYGSDGSGTTNRDTYVIYNIVFAVDAYVPNAQNENTPVSIYIPNTNPLLPGTTLESGSSEFNFRIQNLQPNDEVTVAMNLYNYGNEKIVGPLVNPTGSSTGPRQNVQMNIDIPFGMTLKEATVTPFSTNNDVLTSITNNNPSNYNNHFNNLYWINPTNNEALSLTGTSSPLPTTQMGGVLSWRPIDIPRQNENSTSRKSMAKLTYTLKVIDNCTILKSSEDNCILNSNISGENLGFGANSGTPMAEEFVIGYTNPTCGDAVPIYGNTVMEIVPSEAYFQTCGGSVLGEEILITHFCEPTSDAILDWNEIIDFYPEGTKYYTIKPTESNYMGSLLSQEDPISLNLEAVPGASGVSEDWIYAMLPGVTNLSCYFNIHVVYTTIYTTPVVNTDLTICSNVSFNWPLSLSTVGQESGLSLEVFYFDEIELEDVDMDDLDSYKLTDTHLISSTGDILYYAREVLKNDEGETLCAGPLVPFTISVEGCPIPINPMIQTPLNRN